MSSNEQEHARRIARRIAERIESERGGGTGRDGVQTVNSDTNEVSALQAEFTKLNRRLAQLEAQVGGGQNHSSTHLDVKTANADEVSSKTLDRSRQQTRAPHLMGGGGTYVSAVHPSEQRFGINEAVAELVDYFEAGKTCEMEPGGKPCDHCGMCSARGF